MPLASAISCLIMDLGAPAFFMKPTSFFIIALDSFMSPPFANLRPLSALRKSLPTDAGTPAFLANAGLLATAAMKLCCFLLTLGILCPAPARQATNRVGFPNPDACPDDRKNCGNGRQHIDQCP